MIYIFATILALIIAYMLSDRAEYEGIRTYVFSSYKRTLLAFLPYILLMAFRWNLGHDTNYLTGHYSVGYRAAAQGVNRLNYSIGFFKYFQFLSSRHVPIFFAYFFISVLYMLAICFFVYRIRINSIYAILTFFGTDMFLFAFAAVRQTLSNAFILIALAYYFRPLNNKKKNLIIIIISLMLAFTIHSTALVYIIMIAGTTIFNKFCVCNRKRYLYTTILLVIFTPMIYWIMKRIMAETTFASIDSYTLEFREFYMLFMTVLYIVTFAYYKRICSINRKYFMLTTTVMILLEVFICSGVLYNPDRTFLMFTPIFLILIPTVIDAMKIKSNKMVFLTVFVGLYVLNLRGYFIPGNEDYELFQYHSIFEQLSNILNLYGR